MVKVITYGTYDLLHYGHIRLLERAKALGDYLIVGVTADDFDRKRGKINVQQSLMERIEAVKATGLADEIIVEEYEGQKIDDIRKYHIDIFTVGSDWVGVFDYLREYCQVVYLPRTKGVSSSDLRTEKQKLRFGLIGEEGYLKKFARECAFVNGTQVVGVCSDTKEAAEKLGEYPVATDDLDELLDQSDAVYITSHPSRHYEQIRKALLKKKHVLCEAPLALSEDQFDELTELAGSMGCVLTEGLKTAYSTAYSRLVLLVKGGAIGKPISVDATCTSLRDLSGMTEEERSQLWNTISAWGPTAMLPAFQILGTGWRESRITTKLLEGSSDFDLFSKIDFTYPDAVATVKVGKGIKSEGELVISGTKGYIYVPAPWWKTDYFEIRYENQTENKRYFYQLDGEGIRYEISAFLRMIQYGNGDFYISRDISRGFARLMQQFYRGDYTVLA